MKIVTVVGARPQFIKAACLSRAVRDEGEGFIEEVLVHTGQHYDDGLSAVFFRELAIPEPAYHLGVGSGSHGEQTGRMLAAVERVLEAERPAWVLVYGDTNSTLAGALAAAKLHIPVAHVEAGLRSYNRLMPEEINRVISDHLASLLFCPGRRAVANLAAEGITKGVVETGDIMADALAYAAGRMETDPGGTVARRLGLEPGGYLLATVHRSENTDDPGRLGGIMEALEDLARETPVVLPLHPRTEKALRTSFPGLLERRVPGLIVLEPVGYFDMIGLQKGARVILTDSGGVQKEAYWLGVPCVTLRDETEWVETVAAGWNVLAGTDRERIIRAVRDSRVPGSRPPLYGDGRAAARILAELKAAGREEGFHGKG
ncbi:MAG TPA: UDP-N-acetylglucosamine 2-epimerase (non-hydrolyzing) [Syntrophales bacterium]|nr:UDP-N-acetylglucosamine 2-epimerase (non-hydrolyzing) [Syntrophales bacterium]HRS88046.1 UDP-N-acetylglucosamine 2-epimerase (non-hydrolyzing) [Syntrophales bacterium]